MRSIAYLTSAGQVGFPTCDQLTVGPLRQLGFAVETCEWRADEDWDRFAAVLPRSTWDYHFHSREFFEVLAQIDQSSAQLFNDLEVMRWNAHKGYLRELADSGLRVVDARYGTHLDDAVVRRMRDDLAADDLVIKPVVSASAADTFRLRAGDDTGAAIAALDGHEWMIQPFMTGIVDEGEFSLVYFDGKFSHALLKQARPGDFRVQELHGGINRPVEVGEEIRRRGDEVLAALPADLLYARIDLVRNGSDFDIMEVELIEPSLYLDMDPDAPGQFARALADRLDAGA